MGGGARRSWMRGRTGRGEPWGGMGCRAALATMGWEWGGLAQRWRRGHVAVDRRRAAETLQEKHYVTH